jgi:hypothetical protein
MPYPPMCMCVHNAVDVTSRPVQKPRNSGQQKTHVCSGNFERNDFKLNLKCSMLLIKLASLMLNK